MMTVSPKGGNSLFGQFDIMGKSFEIIEIFIAVLLIEMTGITFLRDHVRKKDLLRTTPPIVRMKWVKLPRR